MSRTPWDWETPDLADELAPLAAFTVDEPADPLAELAAWRDAEVTAAVEQATAPQRVSVPVALLQEVVNVLDRMEDHGAVARGTLAMRLQQEAQAL